MDEENHCKRIPNKIPANSSVILRLQLMGSGHGPDTVISRSSHGPGQGPVTVQVRVLTVTFRVSCLSQRRSESRAQTADA